MKKWFDTIQLEGQKVKLIPMLETHKSALLKAVADGKLWELWFTSAPSVDTIDSYVEKALNDSNEGTAFPFVVLDKKSGKIIGTTRYCNASLENKRLEIGFTWYSERFQLTGVKTECKHLLLKFAFEELNCIAVEFRTNWHNLRSRVAISRLGAKQDGVLRNHSLNKDGSVRDIVVFSITNHEWAGVEKSLKYEMTKTRE